MGSTNLTYSKKSIYKLISFPLPMKKRKAFLSRPFFFSLAKENYLNAPTLRQGIVLSTLPQVLLLRNWLYDCIILGFAVVCLAKVCEHSALPNVMKNPLLLVRVILQRCLMKLKLVKVFVTSRYWWSWWLLNEAFWWSQALLWRSMIVDWLLI